MQKHSYVLMLALAGILCSIGGVCIRLSPWSATAINGGRGLIACCVSCIYFIAIRTRPRINVTILQGAAALCLTMYLHVLCVQMTGAANAVLLMYTSPVFVMLYMWAFKKQRPCVREIRALFIVLAGIVFFVLEGLSLGNLMGNFIGLASGIAYAGVFLANTGEGAEAMSSYFWGQLAAGILGSAALVGESDYSPLPILLIALLGVFQLGLPYILIAKGVKGANPLSACLVTCIEPILCPVWVLLICGESMNARSMPGAVLVIGGILYSCLPAPKHTH